MDLGGSASTGDPENTQAEAGLAIKADHPVWHDIEVLWRGASHPTGTHMPRLHRSPDVGPAAWPGFCLGAMWRRELGSLNTGLLPSPVPIL